MSIRTVKIEIYYADKGYKSDTMIIQHTYFPDRTFKYAVVEWKSDKKKQYANFIRGFDNIEDAKSLALDMYAEYFRENIEKLPFDKEHIVKSRLEEKKLTSELSTSEQNLVRTGADSMYNDNPYTSLYSYGNSNSDGMIYYSVVEWFPGVEHNWSYVEDERVNVQQLQ